MAISRIQALVLLLYIGVTTAFDDSTFLRTSTKRKQRRDSDAKKNVYGRNLQPCSTDGMALTGFTRSGRCVEEQDDKGSHHICIDLSSASHSGKNFCEVTGQSNWCDDKMPCSDGSDEICPVKNWCVCQWAFAKYIDEAGGCEAIQEINCGATNMEAYKAYQKSSVMEGSEQEQIANALKCLEQRCKLDIDVDYAVA
jgi:uncharacterized protein (DUF2237 family)